MRFRLVLFLSALVAAFSMSVAVSMAAVGNEYFDGKDKAVDTAAPDLFRLDPDDLEPGCYEVGRFLSAGLQDMGDENEELQLRVFDIFGASVDQVLVAGENSGYQIYNTFDTGSINNDADIDPNQTATDMQALDGDDVDEGDTIVCKSDHEDSGQNEPYIEDGLPGEVAAVNRPIIQPEIAALGVSAVEPLNTYKVGFGYSIERWYEPHVIADNPAFELDLTDPMAAWSDFTHVWVPTRIDGPVFDATEDGPGVMRVNDIDDFGESFASPHYERADHGQPDVFHMNGDPQAYLHNSVDGPDGSGRGPWGLLTFTTQGDLPISWKVKASLAPVDYMREVVLSDDFLRDWEGDWQAYYCGEGPKPTIPIAPGTNSPAPRECDENPPVVTPPTPPAPAPTNVTNNTTIVQAAPAATVADRCVSDRRVRVTLSKKARKGTIRYVGAKGARTAKARRSGGRLRATADFRGMETEAGAYATVTVREKTKSGWHKRTRLFKLC
jgi:hypothetical protein